MIYNDENFPLLPESWERILVDLSCDNIPVREKIQVKRYNSTGQLAIIDQGINFVGGYTDDNSKLVTDNLPVIVFGDHTRIIKFIDFLFAAGADGIKVLRPKEIFLPKLFFHFLQAIKLPNKGYARHFQHLRASYIAIPPINEQKRIADKLDAILARVGACRERLDRIPALLKHFRQAVLTAATSGKLTEEWRGISQPVEWMTLSLAEVCHSITDGDHQAPPQIDSGIPFITISAINDGRLRLGKASRFVPLSYFEELKKNRRPQRGDILYSVTGSIGIPALVDTDSAFTFQRHIAILKPNYSIISSNYLKYALDTESTQKQALDIATGTAQLTIPLTGLRAFQIGVPSTEEQTEIVRRVESLFAYADRLESHYAAARTKVEKLTPAILAKAFRGELVPQDPNDESASVLLEHIHATTKNKEKQIKTLRTPYMTKHNSESVKAIIQQMPQNRFSFEELHNQVTADYETLKEIIFELLSEPAPMLRQVFDEDTQSMRLEKI